MKKYIFITMNIGGINGAEQYIYNKMNFLKAKGYQVFIFSGRPEKILINGFLEYENLVNPALRFYPYCLNKRELKKTMQWVVSVVANQEGDTCIIESSNVISSLWGELIAKELGCRHLAINMQEHHRHSLDMRKFLEFKWSRHELSGIMAESVGKMLQKPHLEVRADMSVHAYCTNTVQDCEETFSQLLDADADYTFGSIGRLEKEYVPPFVEQLVAYFSSHPDKRYNMLMIGGSSDKDRIKWIKSAFEKCSNVHLVITGQIYPVPRKLVKKADLFLSASGSAAVSYYEMVPSVRVHHVTGEPVGIIGYDYMWGEKVTYDPLPDRTLADCIDQILERSVEITYIEDHERIYNEKMETEFSRHLHFGEETTEMDYYDTLAIRYTILIYRLCSIFCRVFGIRVTYGVLEFVRKLVRGSNN